MSLINDGVCFAYHLVTAKKDEDLVSSFVSSASNLTYLPPIV